MYMCIFYLFYYNPLNRTTQPRQYRIRDGLSDMCKVSDSIFLILIPSDNLYLIADMERKITYVTATEIHTDASAERESMVIVIDGVSFTRSIVDARESFVVSDRERSESSRFVSDPGETIARSFACLEMLE